MPYTDPDRQAKATQVRFPGDKYPEDERHNDYHRRERAWAPEHLVGRDGLYGGATPETESEALMQAVPGTVLASAEDVDADQPYQDAVRRAYVDSLPGLTAAQREAWDLEREGLTQRDSAEKLGVGRGRIFNRLQGARKKLSKALAWVIDPSIRAKYRKPKPTAPQRPIAWTLCMQRIGADLAYIATDDKARWRVCRQLNHAVSIGMDLNDLVRRTGIVPQLMAEMISDFRNG